MQVRSPEEWHKLILEHQKSQEPVTEFCKRHQIHESSFYYWRSKQKIEKSESIKMLPGNARDKASRSRRASHHQRHEPWFFSRCFTPLCRRHHQSVGLGASMFLPASVKIFMSDRPVVMRRGIHGLIAIIRKPVAR